jgi:hypothetical protein
MTLDLRGAANARAVFAEARRSRADSEKTNEQGAKSTRPESSEDENEATEAILSGKKRRRDELQAMDGW